MNTQAIKASIIQGRGREKPSCAVHRRFVPRLPTLFRRRREQCKRNRAGWMQSAREERCRTTDKATQTGQWADEIAWRIGRDILHTSARVSGQNLSFAELGSHGAGDVNYCEMMERNCKSSLSSFVGTIFLCPRNASDEKKKLQQAAFAFFILSLNNLFSLQRNKRFKIRLLNEINREILFSKCEFLLLKRFLKALSIKPCFMSSWSFRPNVFCDLKAAFAGTCLLFVPTSVVFQETPSDKSFMPLCTTHVFFRPQSCIQRVNSQSASLIVPQMANSTLAVRLVNLEGFNF